MRKLFYIFIFGILIITCLSSSKKIYKSLPPGTVRLTDSLYIDKFPVRVGDYIEFLKSIKSFYNNALHDSIKKMPLFGLTDLDVMGLQEVFRGDSMEYIRMLTRTWITYSNDERRYDVDYHLKSSKFYNFPIINVSYEQMRHYCRWRTDMVKLHYATICKTERQRRKYPMNFVYRMVKRKEWEAVLGEYFYDVKKNNEKDRLLNSKPNNIIKSYNKEKGRDFYYDVNNAAETLDNAIVAFNFKWNEQYHIGDISYFKFGKPCDWISFRCICEILPEEITPQTSTEK